MNKSSLLMAQTIVFASLILTSQVHGAWANDHEAPSGSESHRESEHSNDRAYFKTRKKGTKPSPSHQADSTAFRRPDFKNCTQQIPTKSGAFQFESGRVGTPDTKEKLKPLTSETQKDCMEQQLRNIDAISGCLKAGTSVNDFQGKMQDAASLSVGLADSATDTATLKRADLNCDKRKSGPDQCRIFAALHTDSSGKITCDVTPAHKILDLLWERAKLRDAQEYQALFLSPVGETPSQSTGTGVKGSKAK